MPQKLIYTDVVMKSPSNLILDDDNSANIVKQGIEAMNINDFSKILCDKLQQIGIVDIETYNTLIKLSNNDYTSVLLQILTTNK